MQYGRVNLIGPCSTDQACGLKMRATSLPMNRLDRPRIAVPLALLIENMVLGSKLSQEHDVCRLRPRLAVFPSTSAPSTPGHSLFARHNRAAHRATVWRTLQRGVRLQHSSRLCFAGASPSLQLSHAGHCYGFGGFGLSCPLWVGTPRHRELSNPQCNPSGGQAANGKQDALQPMKPTNLPFAVHCFRPRVAWSEMSH